MPGTFEMYPTAFTDRVLSYGGSRHGSSAMIGNGVLRMQLDTSASVDMCAPLRTSLAGVHCPSFTSVRQSDKPVTVTRRGLHLANGVMRTESSSATSNFVSEVMALRQSPTCSLQSVWSRNPVTLNHVVTFLADTHITRSDIAIRNVAGQALPHLAIEGSQGVVRFAYCCVYAGQSVEFLGAKYGDGGSATTVSVLRTTGSNIKVNMLHSMALGPTVTIEDAFAAAARHFRADIPAVDSMVHTRSAHSLRWTSLWNASLSISPSRNASAQDAENVRILNMHLATCMYRMFSDIPDPSVSCATVRSTPYVPFEVHALLPLVPWLVWARRGEMRDVWTPTYSLAGAIVDTWAAFRVTLDRTRLDVHFQLLRKYIDELMTRIEMAGPSPVTGATACTGECETRASVQVPEDAFTTGVVRRAFAAAEQICYVLRSPPDAQWAATRSALVLARKTPYTSAMSQVPLLSNDHMALLHPATLETYMNSTDLGAYGRLIDDHLSDLTTVAAATSDRNCFSAIAALAAGAGRLPNANDAYARLDSCFANFMTAAESKLDPYWGGAACESTDLPSDVLACVMYGFLGARIQGTVSRDGVHTVPAALVNGPATAALPHAWCVARRRSSRGIGERTEFIVHNSRTPEYVC